MRIAALRTLVVPLGFVTIAGCSSAVGSAPPSTADREQLERLEAIARARADSARQTVHPADVAFMQGMIHHHAQALVMSRLAPEAGADPAILTLSRRIINAQRDEIALMQQWLRDRGQSAPEVDAEGRMAAMDDDAMHRHMHMPGMLSPAQLDELSRAQGADYDRLFLAYMIQHHQGAVVMVDDLFAVDGAAQDDAVFKIASDIQVDQRTEIARMQRMLDAFHP